MKNLVCIVLIVSIVLILILTNFNFNKFYFKKYSENFGAGKKQNKTTLNNTLLIIADLLNKNKIKDWFIGYGTLLGIVRNNSCIENDDDIDIIINNIYTKKIIKIFIKNNFKVYKNDLPNFLRIEKNNLAPVDFYLCNVIEDDFHDNHENTIWKNCKPINYYKWNGGILNIPNNPEIKLKNRYGEDWKIPQNSKGNTNYIKNAPVKLI